MTLKLEPWQLPRLVGYKAICFFHYQTRIWHQTKPLMSQPSGIGYLVRFERPRSGTDKARIKPDQTAGSGRGKVLRERERTNWQRERTNLGDGAEVTVQIAHPGVPIPAGC